MNALHQSPFLESAEERTRLMERATRIRVAAADDSTSQVSVVENDWILRQLWDVEEETLKGPVCGCRCDDWSRLRLLLPRGQGGKDQCRNLEALVSDTTFAQMVVLGIAAPAAASTSTTSPPAADNEAYPLPPGIHSNALISNCILEPNCRVYRNVLVRDTCVAANAVLANCGQVAFSQPRSLGELKITVGAESGGGRELHVTAESTMVDVCRSLGMSTMSTQESLNLAPSHTDPPCSYNIIGAGSIVRDTPSLENLYLASDCRITATTSVRNALLLHKASISDACTVSNVFLQWNATISSQSTVTDALLMEQAHAGPHSIVASSILGPDVHVSAGEVHASLIGPNTNSHHQSLVIGVLWPLGRGNVGYGANVGSNHTGRLPDQETASGEGTFWGLSTVIKFPVDLTWSPYSIVAAGMTLPPQRVTMPFSLLVETDGSNHILPGWVLQNSPYTLSRSEAKFAKRRKATRHLHYTGWSIVRPSTVDMCIAAREALGRVVAKDNAVYKTDRAVVGIGKNHLTERARRSGIHAYSQCIHRYALHGLLEWIQRHQSSGEPLAEALEREFELSLGSTAAISSQDRMLLKKVVWPVLPWEEQNQALTWRHQRSILLNEFPVASSSRAGWLDELLRKLVALEKDYAERVYQCKQRDDARGAKTIPGYTVSHVLAEKDGVVLACREFARSTEATVDTLLAEIRRFGALTSNSRSRL